MPDILGGLLVILLVVSVGSILFGYPIVLTYEQFVHALAHIDDPPGIPSKDLDESSSARTKVEQKISVKVTAGQPPPVQLIVDPYVAILMDHGLTKQQAGSILQQSPWLRNFTEGELRNADFGLRKEKKTSE